MDDFDVFSARFKPQGAKDIHYSIFASAPHQQAEFSAQQDTDDNISSAVFCLFWHMKASFLWTA